MTRHYLTTAHAAYLPQLRVLHASMRRHCAPFRLWVLAEGPEVAAWTRDHADVACRGLGKFLEAHPDLTPERLPGPARRPCELAWTWRWRQTADLLAFLGEPVTQLDIDLMFFSSPEPVFEEIGTAEMAVTPHALASRAAGLPGVTLETHARYGAHNAGWVTFAAPAPAEAMAELCRQGPVFEDRLFPDGTTGWGEQGALAYLASARGAHAIVSPANVGPWNIHTQALERRADGGLAFGGRDLIAYHFQSYEHGRQLADAPYEVSGRQAALLYAPYAHELIEAGA